MGPRNNTAAHSFDFRLRFLLCVRCSFSSILVRIWRPGRFHGPDEDEGDLGELPGTTSGQGRRDGTGVLQRLSETSHQRRRPHRGGLTLWGCSYVLQSVSSLFVLIDT